MQVELEIKPGKEVQGVKHLFHAGMFDCLFINSVHITCFTPEGIMGVNIQEALGEKKSEEGVGKVP